MKTDVRFDHISLISSLNEKCFIENYGENQNTFYVRNFFSKILIFMRWCKKNIVEPDRSQMKIWLISIACWIPKVTNTHSEYVICNTYYSVF